MTDHEKAALEADSMTTIDETRLARFLAEAHLVAGAGKGANGAIDVCVVQATDWLTGGNGQTDAPSCVDPSIRAFAIRLNDAPRFSQWRDELKPYAVKIANTAQGPALTEKRGFMCADWAVRVVAPEALDALAQIHPSRAEQYAASAAELRAVVPIVDSESALAAREVARKVRDAARAAADAAAADAATAAYADAATAAYAAYAATAASAAADAADAATAAASAAADAYAAAAAAAAYAAAAYAAYAKSLADKRRVWEMALAHLDALCEASLQRNA